MYREAIRRGTKRLSYRNIQIQESEGQEEEVRPKAKKARGLGEFGQGWEHLTKERSPDPGGKDPETCRAIDAKPQTFTDIIRRRQKDIRTMFSKAEGPAERDTQNVSGGRKVKVSTPVRTKVQRFENISKDPEIGKNLEEGQESQR